MKQFKGHRNSSCPASQIAMQRISVIRPARGYSALELVIVVVVLLLVAIGGFWAISTFLKL